MYGLRVVCEYVLVCQHVLKDITSITTGIMLTLDKNV